MSGLARLYREQGNHAEAETLFGKVLEVRRRVLGNDHPDTLTSMNNLAQVYDDEGKFADAGPLFVHVWETRRHVLGNNHPETVSVAASLSKLRLKKRATKQSPNASDLTK